MNPATLWAEIFVEALYQAGLRQVCISPGSRSTPLTVAFVRHTGIQHSIHLDERSAAFFSLGIALKSARPAALLCTSGTAAAEYFPAIIEASQSNIPLLVLTADRPPEARHSGANQTIDQVKLYGDYVRWSVDAPLPESNPAAHTLRALRTLAARALAVSRGLHSPPGPVHINLPFRKPLEPDESTSIPARSTPAIHLAPRKADRATLRALIPTIGAAQYGLIVAGPRCPGGEFPDALAAFSAKTGWPILADALSGLRFGSQTGQGVVISGYSLGLSAGLLQNAPLPDLVLRFGHMPVSQSLSDYLEKLPDTTPQIGIDANGVWHDPLFRLTTFVAADPLDFVQVLSAELPARTGSQAWMQIWQGMDMHIQTALQDAPAHYEGALIARALSALPAGTQVFVANSLPIRHVDECLPARHSPLDVYANRGASGIDGTISTGLGLSANGSSPTVLVCGDLSFYHDQNGLLALRDPRVRASILLIHNDGGGIFHRLPIAAHEPPFHEAFLTPHGLDFAHTAAQYGLAFQRVTPEHVEAALNQSLALPGSTLIEVRTNAAHSESVRKEMIDILKRKSE